MPRTQRDLLRIAGWCGLAAVALTLLVAWHGTPLPGDVRVIREFQGIRLLDNNETWINVFGRIQWQAVTVLVALLLAAFGPALGLRAGSQKERLLAAWTMLLALALRVLSNPLKEMAQAERPTTDFHIRVTADFAGYGFPSGHVYGDILVYGALAVVAPILFGRGAGAAVRVFTVALIVLAGPARMAVGAHWPSDVLGGYLWGVAALCVALVGGRRLSGQK